MSYSHFVIRGTVAEQAPLFMGFSGKKTSTGCHFLLQGIFSSTQGSNDNRIISLDKQYIHTRGDENSATAEGSSEREDEIQDEKHYRKNLNFIINLIQVKN